MAGHSKWKTTKHKKFAADAIKGKLFTKHAKLIAIAAKNGMDPELNTALKAAIINAKADNVPNDNIKRAIQKGGGEGKDAVQYQLLNYEGYTPGGVAVIIEVLTDNSNRAITGVRTAIEKTGGYLGTLGSVAWMFQDKGNIELLIEGKDKEVIEMDIIESGAEDLEFDEDRVFITTAFSGLGMVRDFLQEKGYKLENVKKDKVPDTRKEITDLETAKKFFACIERIEEDDDVSEIFHNADISDEIMNQLD